jgi:hypothetical protein
LSEAAVERTMTNAKISRRGLGAAVAAVVLAAPAAAETPAAVRELNLPPELAKDLEPRVEAAIREAKWLQELPLDDVPPGFVFDPGGAL